jgi:hypothetical protein
MGLEALLVSYLYVCPRLHYEFTLARRSSQLKVLAQTVFLLVLVMIAHLALLATHFTL